jgi:hypothetical protein
MLLNAVDIDPETRDLLGPGQTVLLEYLEDIPVVAQDEALEAVVVQTVELGRGSAVE